MSDHFPILQLLFINNTPLTNDTNRLSYPAISVHLAVSGLKSFFAYERQGCVWLRYCIFPSDSINLGFCNYFAKPLLGASALRWLEGIC
mgnify:CR=1 FL=1